MTEVPAHLLARAKAARSKGTGQGDAPVNDKDFVVNDRKLKRAVTKHKLIERIKGMEPFHWWVFGFVFCLFLGFVAIWTNVVYPLSGALALAVTLTVAVPGVISGIVVFIMSIERYG